MDPLRIAFYAPFKPLGHRQPSGDLVTAGGIFDFFTRCGHAVVPVSRLRGRWIYWKPWLWPLLARETGRAGRRVEAERLEVWFSYHSYYKAPDLLGPLVSRRAGLPYVLFQGIFSTKRRRRLLTLPGFYLNRWSLRRARHVFTNKRVDLVNLRRLLPEERLTYVAPGLAPSAFTFDPAARAEFRGRWRAGEEPVVLSVAMFRPGVKTEGLVRVIRACGALARRGRRFRLVIAGDGRTRGRLEGLARGQLPGRVHFAGQVPRSELHRYYSAADLFAFPGFQESLGMVYLEAQSCGLPVVACDNAGVPEAVRHGLTGFLVSTTDAAGFEAAIDRLLGDAELRRRMGAAGRAAIREYHDLDRNYAVMEAVLKRVVKRSTHR